MIDVGTGDGLYVYQSARRSPGTFYIGIDPNARALEKISEKIHRKPERGGAPNVLFVQAAVENLPRELDGLAREIHIQLPWGSLLRAVAAGDVSILAALRKMCAPGASLDVVMSFHPDRDRSELDRLGLSTISLDDLAVRYQQAGFEVIERSVIPAPAAKSLNTTWGKKLRSDPARIVVTIRCRAL